MEPIIEFLAEDRISDDESEANKIHRVASRYWLFADRKLYRRSFGGPYLLCLHPGKVDELLAKLHKRVCGSHARERSLVHRAMTQGFWWPKMRNDAAEYVRKYEWYQKHAHLIHQPAGHLNRISIPLAHRAMTQGFWWPKMRNDAAEYVRKCERCQKHAHLIHQPVRHLNPINSPWPFVQWRLDILGPFPRATGN